MKYLLLTFLLFGCGMQTSMDKTLDAVQKGNALQEKILESMEKLIVLLQGGSPLSLEDKEEVLETISKMKHDIKNLPQPQ